MDLSLIVLDDEFSQWGKIKTTFFFAIGVWPVLDIFTLG
jgi:hypothetical protein